MELLSHERSALAIYQTRRDPCFNDLTKLVNILSYLLRIP